MLNSNKLKKGHAIALFSGGLDSILAILLVLKQKIKVTAINFVTDFGYNSSDKPINYNDLMAVAEKFGFNLKFIYIGEKLLEIVRAPKYGYGKNMNPCIDCHILMLREAKNVMEQLKGDFIITGEVLGQRPKSQFRSSLNVIERDSDLKGYLVRPLCAKLLPETIPEKNGYLNRELLKDISGRSRKKQMNMAWELGLENYPAPAGGCPLTDRSYSRRLKDLLNHSRKINSSDLKLLRVGRHFRLDKQTKIIVGRDEQDNIKIEEYAKSDYPKLEAMETGSPITIYIGPNKEKSLKQAAAITARYCDFKNESNVIVICDNMKDNREFKTQEDNNPSGGEQEFAETIEFEVAPAKESIVTKYIIR